jgi:enoyl-CoA hydratase/carnithine racemase
MYYVTKTVINCDMVIAAKKATFALPEVKIGVAAQAGALPRLIRTVGKPRAMDMALTGRTITADEAFQWGLVNKVTGDGEGEVVDAAVEYAKMIAANSPDAVIVTRESVKMGWEGVGAEDGTRISNEVWGPRLLSGENLKEGVLSFVEKRKPRWKPSKL